MVKITHEKVYGGQTFKISINKALNIAAVEFKGVQDPVTSVDIDEHMIFHYNARTRELVGFTILHLKEFCTALRKKLTAAHLKEREWLKRRAAESIYRAFHERKMLNIYQIPQPLWRMQIARRHAR